MGTTFSITHKRFLHSGGTKDYDFVLVECGTKAQSYLIRRWGKVRTKGQLKIDVFRNPMLAKGMLKTEERKREAKDYHQDDITMYSADFLDDAVSRVRECLPYSTSSNVLDDLIGEIQADIKKGVVTINVPSEPVASVPQTKHKDWGLWA
ncbi:WGR domain-containing protein [Vibrio owensii]|uniref:WGR domain-containing protein n=1 Tax=Vibrio owensii TaxID=696485 RepID=UPI003394A2AA